MGYEATMYLLEKGACACHWYRCLELGCARFHTQPEKVKETGDTSLVWEGHKAGRDVGYCHLEKLHNLEECCLLPDSS